MYTIAMFGIMLGIFYLLFTDGPRISCVNCGKTRYAKTQEFFCERLIDTNRKVYFCSKCAKYHNVKTPA